MAIILVGCNDSGGSGKKKKNSLISTPKPVSSVADSAEEDSKPKDPDQEVSQTDQAETQEASDSASTSNQTPASNQTPTSENVPMEEVVEELVEDQETMEAVNEVLIN